MTLAIDKVQRIEGVTVYGDDVKMNRFYLLAEIPRFRKNDDGTWAFSFFKYRNPIERADQSKGGGYLVCDVEFVVEETKQAAVIAKLQADLTQKCQQIGIDPPLQVEIGDILYTDGTARLNVESMSDNFIETVFNPGKPSLYGRMITPFSVELTDLGATFFEQALQAKGGFVQVAYDLKARVKLPPIKVTIWFHSSQFYSFFESYREEDSSQGIFSKIGQWLFGGGGQDEHKVYQSISEVASQYQWGGVDIDWGLTPTSKETEELQSTIRDWAFKTLADHVKTATADPIKPLSDEDRKVPSDATTFKKWVSNYKFDNFYQSYRESQVVDWRFAPQGMLQPITALKDKDGNLLQWDDYCTIIDLDDEFFKVLEVAVRANADFKNLPLDSVEVHMDYNQGATHRIDEFSFTSPDDVRKFKTFIENSDWHYSYYTQVNYEGESRSYQSETKTTDEKFLTINVGDLGILAVDILVGDINWQQVSQAHVTVRYDGAADGIPIERQYILDAKNTEHSLREVIFAPVSKPYHYTVKYLMADGKEMEVSEAEGRSPQLYIRDPFGGQRRVGLRAVGNLDTDVQTIFADVRYVDEKHEYTRMMTVALGKSQPFFDWDVPVIDESIGYVVVKASIQYKNGQVETLPELQTTDNTILLGPIVEDMLEVKIVPTLVDFTKADLVQVSLQYQDLAHGVNERTDLIFDPSAKAAQTWSVALKDKTQKSYTWQATYYMKDGSAPVTPAAPKSTDMLSLVLPRTPMA